jgi:hypothetical protein
MKLSGYTVLIVLLVVTVAWVGGGVYFSATQLDIDPNATSYMQFINPSFESTILTDVETRVEENLPISPSEFKAPIDESLEITLED